MRFVTLFTVALVLAGLPDEVRAQRNQKKFDDFVKSSPAVGDAFPELAVCTSDGRPFQTSGLRGNFTVLTFGCLT